MVSAITEFGFRIPLLVRSDGELIDGHLRLKAAQRLGLQQLPVILCDDWTAAQVKAFRLLVNRSATWAEWDLESVSFELQELKAAEFRREAHRFHRLRAGLPSPYVPAPKSRPKPYPSSHNRR